jgi:glycosyltransferase involved in cell wall biosynthesis
MTENLKLSVVMATYRRAETLRETIHHLADQDLDPGSYEVIIIDDGSPDDTRAVVQEAQARVPFQLTYLHHANRGPGATQNRGIRAAAAPIVLLMADDIFMSRQALSAHLAFHDAYPEPEVAVLGRVQQSNLLTQTVFLRTWDPFRFSDFEGLTELPYFRFWACNISFKRDFMLQHGLFREAMGRAGAAAHEDAELGHRLSRHGLRVLYCSAALGFHDHVVTLQQACERAHQRGLNFGEFRQFVPEPEIPVAYHVLSFRTLGDHARAVFGPRRRYLSQGDRNPLLLSLRYALRALAFNGVAVGLFWRPFLDAAERHPTLARLVNQEMYRGTIFYYFLVGCAEGDRRYGRPRQIGPRSAETPS